LAHSAPGNDRWLRYSDLELQLWYRGVDAFIDELYIEPQWRRMGFGRQAMQQVESQARGLGVNALHLEVDRETMPQSSCTGAPETRITAAT